MGIEKIVCFYAFTNILIPMGEKVVFDAVQDRLRLAEKDLYFAAYGFRQQEVFLGDVFDGVISQIKENRTRNDNDRQ